MDNDARDSCLRAIRLVARNARIAASVDRMSTQYAHALESADRLIERAQRYYLTMKQGHQETERQVRLVLVALVEARQLTLAMAGASTDPEDLDQAAGKVERAIDRATPPTVA
jgi:hypothetical protein